MSLPDAPLDQFRRRVAGLPRTTEAERLVVQRVGQNIFRDALLEYWNGRCPMTGITDPALLRASHIVPWAECESDAQRLDVYNGLLLSALWDAAFDAGRVSFADTEEILLHPGLGAADRKALTEGATARLKGMTSKYTERRAGGEVVHVEVAAGVVIVVAAWMLDPAACAGMTFGTPRVSVSAPAELPLNLRGP